jgi:putative FmdB family regulatory protein
MPTYDYACTECSHAFEHFQTMTSDLLTDCPECQGKLKRLIGSGGALIFKGSGFYCTDYKKPSGGAAAPAKSDGSADSTADSSADSSATPSKSESSSSGASSDSSSSGGGDSGSNESAA